MTLYNRRREKLINQLKNKEYRDAFIAEHIDTGIPFQIKTLREQRKWTQRDLGKLAEMKQERISVLEDPNYAKLTLSTLKKLASVFDVGLIVRFVPISELVEWELGLSSESLQASSFKEDKYFKKETGQYVPTEADIAIALGDKNDLGEEPPTSHKCSLSIIGENVENKTELHPSGGKSNLRSHLAAAA